MKPSARRAILLAALLAILVPGFVYAAATSGSHFDEVNGVQFTTGLKIGGAAGDTSSLIGAVYVSTPTLDVPSLATTCTTDTFTVTGAAAGDYCSVAGGAAGTEAFSLRCIVSATNTVKVIPCTFGTVNPASQVLTIKVEHLTP